MTDLFDRASDREQQMRDDALAERARRANAGRAAESATHCSECEAIIPEPRRLAVPGVHTCIDCQTDIERGLITPGGR